MTESSLVIENGLNLLLKNFWRWSGVEGESVLVENRIYRSHFYVCNLSGAERQLWRAKYRNFQPSVSDETVETG